MGRQLEEADALAFALGPVSAEPSSRGRRIEVQQVWGQVVLGSRTFALDEPVALGWGDAHRWRFLGVDMGRVPGWVAPLARALPLWSDVTEEVGADFLAPELDERWAFVVPQVEGSPVARIAAGWDGFSDQDGLRSPLPAANDDGERVVPLDPGRVVVVEVGASTFVLRSVPTALPAAARLAVDPGFVGLLAGAAAVFSAIVGLSALQTPHHVVVAPADEEVTTAILQRTDPIVEVKRPVPADAKKATGTPKKGPEGKQKGPIRTERQVAEAAGVLSDVDAILGTADLNPSLMAGIGSLIGHQASGLDGSGLGSRGTGLTGGGEAEGLGGCCAPGRPTGYGAEGGGDHGGKQVGELQVPEGTTVLGGIDRSVVDEVVKRNLDAIRYCYQRELPRNPTLGGKLVVKFTIGQDGQVSEAGIRSSTMGSAAVESCIQRRFLMMTFPPPKGLVIVSYPFLFSR